MVFLLVSIVLNSPLYLSDGTMLELCAGQLTSEFKFCCDSANLVPQNSATQAVAISLLTNGVEVGCD